MYLHLEQLFHPDDSPFHFAVLVWIWLIVLILLAPVLTFSEESTLETSA